MHSNDTQITIKDSIISQVIEGFPGFSRLDKLENTQKIIIPFDSSMEETTNFNMNSVINTLDLVYYNNFRIFLFFKPDGLEKYLSFPNLDFQIRQIGQPLKFISTPLTLLLTEKSGHDLINNSSVLNSSSSSNYRNSKECLLQFGFLTIDQNKRICPLVSSDPLIMELPLVGVWLYGIKINGEEILMEKKFDETYKVWGLLTEFVKNTNFKKKYSYDEINKNFLLVAFNQDENPKFYEAEMMNDKEKANEWIFMKCSEPQENINDLISFDVNNATIIQNMSHFHHLLYERKKKSPQKFQKSIDKSRRSESTLPFESNNFRSSSFHIVPSFKYYESRPKPLDSIIVDNSQNTVPVPEKMPKLEDVDFRSPRFSENSSNMRSSSNINQDNSKEIIIKSQANQLAVLQKQIEELQVIIF